MAHYPDAAGAEYDDAFFAGYGGRLNQYWWARRFYASLITRHRSGGKLLEVGCGLGHVLMRLEERFETYGIDVSPFAIERAREVTPRSDVRVGAAEDVAQLPGPFDVLASFHVVEHLVDPGAVLKLWAENLRPGGLLVYATPNPDAPFARRKGERWHGAIPSHISLKKPREWQRITREAGFRIKRAFGDGLWDVPYLPVIPSKLQLLMFGMPAAVQTVTTMPFIPVRWGESLIVVAERE